MSKPINHPLHTKTIQANITGKLRQPKAKICMQNVTVNPPQIILVPTEEKTIKNKP